MSKVKTPDEQIKDVMEGSRKRLDKIKMNEKSKEKGKLVLAGLITVIPLAFLFGWIIQLLWNWLMPSVFNLSMITYWQGVGLFLLGRLFFGK